MASREYICKEVPTENGGYLEIETELIRCRDCKYYEVAELNYDGTPDKRCKPSICANGWYEYAVERDPNWFCADAEPNEEYGLNDFVRKEK